MERTIDRTSYRRSARSEIHRNVKEVKYKKNNVFRVFLNQLIISLLIIITLLSLNFLDITVLNDWISNNMSDGMEFSEVLIMLKNSFQKMFSIVSGDNLISGDGISDKFNFGKTSSGDISGDVSGDASGETLLLTAVEGVNQMSDDSNYIKLNYDVKAPLRGTITSRFGSRISDSAIVSSYHTGLDIAANTGTNIISAHSGIVTLAETYSTYGKCIMIEDGILKTVYAHCSSINVKKNQKVNQGEIIGKVGMTGNATGPHLHFEIRLDGRFVNPEDVLGEM